MIFWCSLCVLCTILCIVFIKLSMKVECDNFWHVLCATICGVSAFLILVGVFSERLEYNKFERSLEIQRNVIEQIYDERNILDYNFYIADIVDANAQLADYQASKEYYGIFTIVPDRVMDIKPIGVK